MRALEIQALREAVGLTRSEMATKLGVSADLVVDWESGERFPTRKHCEALLDLRPRNVPNEDGVGRGTGETLTR